MMQKHKKPERSIKNWGLQKKREGIMLFRHIALLFAVLSACLSLGNFLFADYYYYGLLDQHKYPDYEPDLRRLSSFIGPGKLNSFEKVAEELQQKWIRKDMRFYYDLVLNCCRILSSLDFKDTRQHKLEQTYAIRALKKPTEKKSAEIPLEIEISLLYHLKLDRDYDRKYPARIKGEDWMKQRLEKVQLWFHVFQRFEKEIDKNFDFSNLPNLQPPLPAGVNLPRGIAPEAIKDPKARAEYEKLIAEHKRKVEKYNRQYRLNVRL